MQIRSRDSFLTAVILLALAFAATSGTMLAQTTGAPNIVEVSSRIALHNELVNSAVPVIVDYQADGCAACVVQREVLFELALKNNGKLKIVRIWINRPGSEMTFIKAGSLSYNTVQCDQITTAWLTGSHSSTNIKNSVSQWQKVVPAPSACQSTP